MTAPIEKLLYTRKEAAMALSLSVGTIDVLIGEGRIRARRIGRLVRIPRQELLRLTREDVLNVWPEKRDGKTVRTKDQDPAGGPIPGAVNAKRQRKAS